MKVLVIWLLILLSGITGTANTGNTNNEAPDNRLDIWVAPECPPQIWEKGYGKEFPVKYIFKNFADLGFTDITFYAHQGEAPGGRGPTNFYHNTKVKNAKRCSRMDKDREWLEEVLTEADKYNIRIWLTLTPAYKVKGTDIAGLNDPRQIKIWTDIINEYGKYYKPRHKSLYGLMFHEFNCAEARDTHHDDFAEFKNFCWNNFRERYTGEKMPDGTDGSKWNRRFYIYKNAVMNNFIRKLKNAAAKYGMQTSFPLYTPERSLHSAAWGYDSLAIEKMMDRIDINSNEGYDYKNVMRRIGYSYKGANVPREATRGFHGRALTMFEYRIMLFPMVMQKAYRKKPRFTKIFGDFLRGYSQKSKKVIDLFLGTENIKKWISLQREWIGAKPLTRIAMLAASRPFVLRFAPTPGIEYKKVLTNLRNKLRKHYPVAIQLMGTIFTLDPKNLSRYELLIIPDEMGICMDESFLKSLKSYLAAGGKVLALGSPITTGNSDLTKQADHTEELFGVKVAAAAPLPGYVMLKSDRFKVPDKKIWSAVRDIQVISADEVLARNKFTEKPVMTRKGNAYYLACGSEESSEIIRNFIDMVAPQPMRLNGNDNFEFYSIVRKDNILCVALPCEKTASAKLVLDMKKLGLKGDRFEVKNIIIGKSIGKVNANELKKGIKIKTDYDNEPYVLVVGPENKLARFKGVYPDNKVFADMGKITVIENPEVAIAIPDRPGIKVGIYQNAYGAEEIYKQMGKMPEFNCFYLPRLDGACMAHADVIVIPQAKSTLFFDNAINVIQAMVQNGKGLVLTHDATVEAAKIFPEIIKSGKKIRMIEKNAVKIIMDTPVTADFKSEDKYIPGFAYDHYALQPGKDAQILARDLRGNNVVLAGKYGKGEIVAFGTLPGCFCPWDDSKKALKGNLKGKGLQLLTDSIKWLAKNNNKRSK